MWRVYSSSLQEADKWGDEAISLFVFYVTSFTAAIKLPLCHSLQRSVRYSTFSSAFLSRCPAPGGEAKGYPAFNISAI
jgi:hypothetical protein